MSKFEIYKDKKGETRFRYRASNGEIVFSSEGYKVKASATKAINAIKKSVPNAPVEEATPAKKSVAKTSAPKTKPAAKPTTTVKAAAGASPKAAKAPTANARAAAKPKV